MSEENLQQNEHAQISAVNYPVLTALLCLVISAYFLLRRNPRIDKHLSKFGGPPTFPLLGNALLLLRPHNEYMTQIGGWVDTYGTVFRLWVGNMMPYILFAEPSAVEKVLSTTSHIDKGKFEYANFYPWLGWGLLTAPRQKWFPMRKLLTPSFHFKILEDFMPIFNEQASIFLACLRRDGHDKSTKIFDMYDYITKCTLDIICETAMGKRMNAQTSDVNKTYTDAVNGYCALILDKTYAPWLQIPFVYNLTSMSKREARYLEILKGFSSKVIQARKLERKATKLKTDNKLMEGEAIYGKKRKAFLDLLLDTAEDQPDLTDNNIREEVDTFMFEGHDTTGVNLAWTVLMLAIHPDCQKQVQRELDEIFSNDPTRDVTPDDIAKMKYLECCVKETLRLYPSVPFIMRQIDGDIPLENGKLVPKGTQVAVGIYFLHRNKDHFPEPLLFKPERFNAENSAKRHAYAYVPFSAGPRNCIGQKFALMEEKVILAKLFREYTIETEEKMETLCDVPDVVLRSENGVQVKLRRRKIN